MMYYLRRRLGFGWFKTYLGVVSAVILYLIFYFNWDFQDEDILQWLLQSAMPVLVWTDSSEEPQIYSLRTIVNSLFSAFYLNKSTPLSLLEAAMPLLAQVNVSEEAAVPAVTVPVPVEQPALDAKPVFSSACILIYHTHTGETYTLTDGIDRLPGKRGGVVTVGKAMKWVLEMSYGLRVVHSDKIHDSQYNISYKESEKTVRELLTRYPETVAVLDIHRDAGISRQNSLVRIGGQEVAPVIFIVGSDARSPFPTWKHNYNFAKQLADRLDAKYPGLCQGVRVKEGRYNQFLHPRALLVEIGSASNSTEEAVASAHLFARILGEVLCEIIEEESASR